MKSFLNNRPIGFRIMLMLVLPIAGLLAFAALNVAEKSRVFSEMTRLERVAQVTPAASALIHELQRERGASSGFVESKGQKFTATLSAACARTDTAMASYRKSVDALLSEQNADALAQEFSAVSDSIGRVADIIPTCAVWDSFWGFPNGQKSESMWRTKEEVRHGCVDCLAGRL